MGPRVSFVLIASLSGLFGFVDAAARQDAEADVRPHVEYVVDATKPDGGEVTVEMTVMALEADPLVVSIPAWRPGSYRIQNYSKTVQSIKATGADGKELAVTPLDTQTWSVRRTDTRPVTFTYVLKPGEEALSAKHYEIHGPALFFYVVDHKDLPCRAQFKIPEAWKIATGLTAARAGDKGVVYTARDYDTFADCPVELGQFELHAFTEGGAKYEFMVHAPEKYEYDVDKLTETLRKIVGYETKLMGGAPYDRYLFLFHFDSIPGGYGLEHLNSTSIHFNSGMLKRDSASIAGLVSHEFFHLWNVKRLRPKPLGPFDYTKEVRTRALWLCEGVTSYYGDLTLVRSGLWSRKRYLRSLQEEIMQLQKNPQRLKVSVEMASWTEFDKPGPEPVDYYNKGLLLGLLIDLKMRELTGGRRTFDDVMNFLFRWFIKGGKGPIGEGFEEGDILRAVSAVSGHDFADFFNSYVSGTVELPFKEILGAAGVECAEKSLVGDPGFSIRSDRVSNVVKDGPAERAGLQKGDEILKVNGTAVNPGELRFTLSDLPPNKELKLVVRRDEKETELAFTAGERAVDGITLKFKDSPPEAEKRILESWLSGNQN